MLRWARSSSRGNGSFPKGARRLSEKSPARHPPPHRRDGIGLGARASRPRSCRELQCDAAGSHPVRSLWPAAELQCDAAGSHPVGGNPIGQAEGEPWLRSRLIQVGEMGEAVPGLVRAGRPRSQASLHPMTSSQVGEMGKGQAWCGRDARACRSLHPIDIVTPRAQMHRIIWRVAEASSTIAYVPTQISQFPLPGSFIPTPSRCRLSLKEVHLSSGSFVPARFVSIGGSSSLTIGRFSSNDPHGRTAPRSTRCLTHRSNH